MRSRSLIRPGRQGGREPRADMNGDELRSRYEFLKQLTSDGVRTHLALTSAGGVALVHLLDDCPPGERDRILASIDRLGEDRRAQVLEVIHGGDGPAVVTRHMEGFTSLVDWLGLERAADPEPAAAESNATGPAVEPTLPAPAFPSPGEEESRADEPGEFTRLFEVPAVPGVPSVDPGDEPANEGRGRESVEEAPPPGPAAEGPGEFTRLFEMPDLTEPSAEAAVPGAAAAPLDEGPLEKSDPAGSDPGSPAADRPAAEPTAPEASPPEAPGEFTRLFGTPGAPEAQPGKPAADRSPSGPAAREPSPPASPAAPPAAPAPPPTPTSSAKEGGTGEFTRLFGRPQGAPPTTPFSWPAARGPSVEAPRAGAGEPPRQKGTGAPGGEAGKGPFSGIDDSYLERLHAPGPGMGGRDEPGMTGAAPQPSDPPAPPELRGPSEFTRVISAQPPPTGPEKPPPPAFLQAPQQRRRMSRRGFLIGMTLVVLAALALVLYFALPAGDAGSDDPEPAGTGAGSSATSGEARARGAAFASPAVDPVVRFAPQVTAREGGV
jgi:hypothetical protein